MRKLLAALALIFAVVLLTPNLFSQEQEKTQIKKFMPENSLSQQDGLFDNGMTEQDFNNIIDSVEKYFIPIVKEFGADLVVNRRWSDTTVNAYAHREGDTWMVDMFGGLARRPEITFDGFAMVLCHEIGHHLSGFPFVSDWAANEGQSDYFAMHVCSKIIWKNDENVVEEIDPVAKSLCDNNADPEQSLNLCYREMNASYALARLLGALNGEKVSFNTPDTKIVKKTNNDHPKAQCRLDTYVASTLCEVKWNTTVIPQTEKESSNYLCVNKLAGKYDIKARPRCWFKPT